MHGSVFFDPTQRRWRRVKLALVAGGAAFLAAGTFFLVSLVAVPRLSALPALRDTFGRVIPRLPNRQHELRRALAAKTIGDLRRVIEAHQKPGAKPDVIVAAFYAPWQETGLHSLAANASKLTHVMPAWLRVSASGDSIDFTDWNPAVVPHNLDVVKMARANGVQIHPVLSNAEESWFDPDRVGALLQSEKNQKRVALSVRAWLVAQGFQGVNVDFENIPPEDAPRFPGFVKILHDTLAPDHLQVSVDLQPSLETDWKRVAAPSDFAVVMGYDEHSAASHPGSIASIDWFRRTFSRALQQVPREKLVVGLGNYGYDWAEGSEGAVLSYQQTLYTANTNRSGTQADEVIDFDPATLNPTFDYVDSDGKSHEVWMLDAVTAANQWTLARRAGIRGASLWALGLEDPSIWSFLGRDSLDRPIDLSALRTMSYPYAIDFIGHGELLSVVARPTSGSRALEVDPTSRLCLDERYLSFPTPYVLRRQGFHPRVVALTIDDGPSSYTPAILDVLHKEGVKATFFLIGENAQRHPDLVRRIWDEGHDIGNHSFTHPNIGTVSRERAVLEINATQRVIESEIGHSTILFRPPYNADAEPTSAEELRPVSIASDMGYVTVGEFIDPEDWLLDVVLPGGIVHRRTGAEIAREIIDGVHRGNGNGVLLHDGGGDRSATIEALRIAIPELKREGYRFASISELLNTSRESVMPRVGKEDAYMLGDDKLVFEAMYSAQVALTILFISAIVLGGSRILFVSFLAVIARVRERNRTWDPAFAPSVSVLIAAYNEEKLIARTITAVLASDYSGPLEVIVVDDGSADETLERVRSAHGSDARVVAWRQENGGKASALNAALRSATGEIVVALDADTLFRRDTIRMLVRRFADPAVGAVAGNVKVGNRINAATAWQSIEYITSQNLDRRAYALLNSVTVVPGAVGAWRRDALVSAGAYVSDTLAEDMDLTWRVRMLGWRIETESEAIGLTEAPDTVRALFGQRFRWAYGTLQSLWKHRSALGRYGWFGRLMLPSLWLFQIVYQLVSPVIDVQIVLAAVSIATNVIGLGMTDHDWALSANDAVSLEKIVGMYVFFLVIELFGALVAFSLEGERKRQLGWLFVQRFFYRQLMYAVVWKAVKTALAGIRAGWGKLERKGTVEILNVES